MFVRVVRTDTELQEPTWTRKVRLMHLQIYNTEGRLLKDRAVDALFNEHRHTFGYQGWTSDAELLRDPVVNETRRVNICCRMTYRPDMEKSTQRPMSPPMSAGFPRYENGPAALTEQSHNSSGGFHDPRAIGLDPVGANLRQILGNPKFSDVELVVGAQRRVFPGHRAILAARSSWFARALDPAFRESFERRIQLPEDDPEVFELLLDYLYTGEYPLCFRKGRFASQIQNIPPDSAPSNFHYLSGRFSSLSMRSTTSSPRTVSPYQPDDETGTSPPSSPPSIIDDSASSYGYYENEEDDAYEIDELKYRLYVMADKFCVSQLKCLIRLDLTNDLLDPTNVPSARFLRLVRFAFDPYSTEPGNTASSTTTVARCSDEDSGRVSPTPSAFGEVYSQPPLQTLSSPRRSGMNSFGTRTQYGLPTPTPDPQLGPSPHPPPSTTPSEVGVAVTTSDHGASTPTQTSNQLLRAEPPSSAASWRTQSSAPSWAGPSSPTSKSFSRNPARGDTETSLLQDSVAEYVAKLYPAVVRVAGFEEMISEGGEMARFVVMVMNKMFRP